MKLVVIGSQSVGKTSIINFYITGGNEILTMTTVQLAFSKKVEQIGDRTVSLQICDTAGQEQFQSVCPNFYRDAQAALVVFDVTSPDSFQRIRYWLDELNATMPESFLVCVVGNKVDLVEERAVTKEDSVNFAIENGALYQETSAVTGMGISAAFGKVCEKYVEMEKKGREALMLPHPAVELDQPEMKNEEKCC
jgi:small GTP-binding protein